MGEQGTIEYVRRPEYLHATMIGLRTRDFVARSCHEMLEECARLGCRRLLIETRLGGPAFSVTTVFELMRHFIAEVKGQRDPVSMVAIVGPYRDIPKLAEIASANRAVKIAGFTDIAVAESWLLGAARDGGLET